MRRMSGRKLCCMYASVRLEKDGKFAVAMLKLYDINILRGRSDTYKIY